MSEPVLSVRGLRVAYDGRGGALPHIPVRDVSFDLQAGEIVGLVGESGSGKSSIGRALVGLIEPAGGSVESGGDPRSVRRRVQYIPQGPLAALNPRLRCGRMIQEALQVGGGVAGSGARVKELLDQVGLDPGTAGAFPHQLSGGQRKRIALARALAVGPTALICDEMTDALDLSAQARILRLLRRLSREQGLGTLFISHDLPVVGSLCDRLLVLAEGSIVEQGPTTQILGDPRHPRTQLMVDSVLDVERI